VPFVLIGAALLLRRHLLPPVWEHVVVAIAAVVTVFMATVLILLQLRALSTLERKLRRGRWAARFATAFDALTKIEAHLFHIVRRAPLRFGAALALAFVNWLTGALEMYLIFRFLGAPISLADAWLAEATVVLVRSVTFFIPAHLGAQEGAITLVAEGLTGSPEIGVAVALVRRGRELVWSGCGLLIGGWFGLRQPQAAS
jgi:hypothetical protein